ncbi:hypothetical protein [Martelella sp. HB161492]|uniref:hypothetical protein n=1 Tax=Martelella sp. HB161492 TaxID=2720726 RepID=UPI0015929FE1|nr:hypothetical protein [Martelella sp. HB161492]
MMPLIASLTGNILRNAQQARQTEISDAQAMMNSKREFTQRVSDTEHECQRQIANEHLKVANEAQTDAGGNLKATNQATSQVAAAG